MTRTRWEYMQVNHSWPKLAMETAALDEEWTTAGIGAEGWELVNVVRTPSGVMVAFFKRPLPQPPPTEMDLMRAIEPILALDRNTKTLVDFDPQAKIKPGRKGAKA